MKAGLLVNIIDPSENMKGLDAFISKTRSFGNIGKSGIVLSKYHHATATCGKEWFMVLVEGVPLTFREDHLETV